MFCEEAILEFLRQIEVWIPFIRRFKPGYFVFVGPACETTWKVDQFYFGSWDQAATRAVQVLSQATLFINTDHIYTTGELIRGAWHFTNSKKSIEAMSNTVNATITIMTFMKVVSTATQAVVQEIAHPEVPNVLAIAPPISISA